KVVRAGTGAGATPCDAANSAGCWYTVFYDQFVEATATSSPSTETITTGSRSSGTFPTDILSSNNVYLHYTEANPLIAFVNDGSSANPDFWLTASASSYATASWTPPTSGLLVLFVGDEVGSGTPNQPTVSGNSVTWTAIKTINVGLNRFTLFGANSAGSAAGATTVAFAGQSQSGCEASFFHVTNVDLSGGVTAAFVQSPTGSGTAVSGSITLASPGNSANRPVSGWFHAAQEDTLTTAELNSGAPAVRFIGATEIGDVTQSDLYLDYVTISSNSVWDRVVLMRSRDTSGSTWSGQVVLASGRSGDSPLVL